MTDQQPYTGPFTATSLVPPPVLQVWTGLSGLLRTSSEGTQLGFLDTSISYGKHSSMKYVLRDECLILIGNCLPLKDPSCKISTHTATIKSPFYLISMCLSRPVHQCAGTHLSLQHWPACFERKLCQTTTFQLCSTTRSWSRTTAT